MRKNFNGHIKKFLSFLGTDLLTFAKTKNNVSKNNFGYVRLYMEETLIEFRRCPDLWLVYCCYLAQELCQNNALKLQLIERSLKYCNSDHRLWIAYLEEMERQEKLVGLD